LVYKLLAEPLAIPSAPFKTFVQIDNNGIPSLFANTNTTNSFPDAYPGGTGMRALLRLAAQKNLDISLAKSFKLPWEGHRIQFRAEAYNALNNVNFIQPSLALHTPTTLGEFQGATQPREMQCALRYEL
jgi:hypothetical protein